ncbi:MAG TPA: TonB C-terminal domain-containing protein [Vicinamibacterales bacterium]|nr:TonB C-terminal domain-containing protein [Vicinamibacterales bacterium]
MDAVTEVLIDRSREAERLTRMVVVSLVLHGTLITAVTLLPRFLSTPPAEPAHVMTISLGGAPGPMQGHNPISAKPVQEAAPETTKPKEEAPPALAKPEMIEPVKAAKPQPRAAAKPEPKKEIPQLHGRTPTTGPEVKQGAARIETHGSAIPFGGLATGGGGGGAAYTDYADFCCPEYLTAVTQLIQRNWQPHQQQDGSSGVKFTIHRDGSVTDIAIEEGANEMLNLASKRAIVVTVRVPPLPAAFTPEHLTLHIVFQYQR